MKQLFTLYITCFLLFPAAAQPTGDSLLLQQVIETALALNPSIMASKKNVEIYEGLSQSARGIFNSYYSFNTSNTRDIYPNTINFREGLFGNSVIPSEDERRFRYGLDASKLLPSGATINGGFGMVNYGKDPLYNRLLDAGMGRLKTNTANVYLNLRQPLMRGRGRSFQEAGIKIADISTKSQREQFYYDASAEVLDVILNYVSYVAARNNLEIQLATEKRFKSAVSDLERLVELDALPAAEMLFIKANTAIQVNSRIYAENNLAYLRNALGAQMGLTHDVIARIPLPVANFPIQEITIPDSTYLDQWLDKSLVSRPDYLSLLQVIESSEVEVDYNRQRIKPQVDLHAGVGYNGIYEGRGFGQYVQPLGSNIPGMSYSVGISIGIAPAFDEERGDLKSSMAGLETAYQNRKALENSIHLNVKRYYDQLRYFKEVVASSKLAVEYNKTALKNEYTKLKLGSSTVINVVQIQNNYVLSLNSYNRALQDLNTAFFLFRFHTGTLLQTTEAGDVAMDYEELLEMP